MYLIWASADSDLPIFRATALGLRSFIATPPDVLCMRYNVKYIARVELALQRVPSIHGEARACRRSQYSAPARRTKTEPTRPRRPTGRNRGAMVTGSSRHARIQGDSWGAPDRS